MSRRKGLHRNNGTVSRPPAPNRRNSFLRHYKDIGTCASAVAAGLTYKKFANARLRQEKAGMLAKMAQINAKSGEIARETKKALREASKEDKELAEEASKSVDRKMNANKGKEPLNVVEEYEKELRGDDGQLLVEEQTFEIVMRHARKQEKELSGFIGLWEQEREFNRECELLDIKTAGVIAGSGLAFILAFSVLELAVARYRSRKMRKKLEIETEEGTRRLAMKKEERAKRKEEKRKGEEKEMLRAKEAAAKYGQRTSRIPAGETKPKKERRGPTKNDLKKGVAALLKPEFGEDAMKASKAVFRTIGRVACKSIIDNPDEVYEIIAEHCGEPGQESGLEWIIDRISEQENGEALEEEAAPCSALTYEMLELPGEVEKAIRERGLKVNSVKVVAVNGFKLHAAERAIGKVYHRVDRVKTRIDAKLRKQGNPNPGKERDAILDFLWTQGVRSTYKQGGRCTMINTVPDFGQSRPITEVGEKTLSAIVDWVAEYKKQHRPGG